MKLIFEDAQSDRKQQLDFEKSLYKITEKYDFSIGRIITQLGYIYAEIIGNEDTIYNIGKITLECNYEEYKTYPISLTIERSDGDEDTWYCTTFREALDYVDRWLHDEYDWFN